jgi:hypothetical protein
MMAVKNNDKTETKMKKANNPQNLKPFKKGVSGNPAGRPRKLPGLDELLIETLGDHLTGAESMKGILIALRKRAASGDVRACELLLDRSYGKVRQPSEINLTFENLSESQLDEIVLRILNKQK